MNASQTALWPFSVLYSIGVRLRNAAYNRKIAKPKRLPGVVISVGNLTVGGTGKTPTVLWLSEALLAQGKNVAVLTRGYRGFSPISPKTGVTTTDGRLRKTVMQIKSNQLSDIAGQGGPDEPSLLVRRIFCDVRRASRFAVGVSADRFTRGSNLAKRGFDWFILDDGFQHRRLARDLDILLIDSSNPFGGGRLLPSGRLREPPSSMRRADLIIITRSAHPPAVESAIRRDSAAPIFYSTMKLNALRDSKTLAPAAIDDIRPSPVFAFCGIGNPSAFLQNLREWGFTVAGLRFFPDHHVYSQSELAQLRDEARAAGATILLCTEKDAINLATTDPLDIPILYCEISLDVADADAFWNAARDILQRRRPEIEL